MLILLLDIATAHCGSMKGRYDDAVRNFEKAVELRAGFADTHRGLGLALLKMGNTAAALAQCDLLHSVDTDKERDLRNQITSETA